MSYEFQMCAACEERWQGGRLLKSFEYCEPCRHNREVIFELLTKLLNPPMMVGPESPAPNVNWFVAPVGKRIDRANAWDTFRPEPEDCWGHSISPVKGEPTITRQITAYDPTVERATVSLQVDSDHTLDETAARNIRNAFE